MTDRQLRELIAKRNSLKKWLEEADRDLKAGLKEWSRERGYLVTLDDNQALRAIGNVEEMASVR